MPASRAAWPKATDTYWANSTGRRNTSMRGAAMGRPAGWMKELTGRSAMKSPGKPSHRREVERRFWRRIAEGLSSEDAAHAVGVASAGGGRLVCGRGGLGAVPLGEG